MKTKWPFDHSFGFAFMSDPNFLQEPVALVKKVLPRRHFGE